MWSTRPDAPKGPGSLTPSGQRRGSSASEPSEAGKRFSLWTRLNIGETEFQRLPLHTHWLNETDDLVLALMEQLKPAQPGDTVAVSEKVVVLLTGRAIDLNTIKPGRLARFLSRYVRNRDSSGRMVPEKMEYVVRTVGYARVLAAAIGLMLTRPFGLRGTFFQLVGPMAKNIGGAGPPYEDLLFPPLDVKFAKRICMELERILDIGVSIVNVNDFGGSIRAVSPRSLSGETLARVLIDNPMGGRLTSTPFVLIRPVSTKMHNVLTPPQTHSYFRF
jgi:hypothetical protein